ncbi:carbamate kinase [Bythopirellula polymerisocia]|uniref:Carbamate kinase n=1 Tax=Bythopirellula polymerisocia TaxID=2528003 RepID=A0A5C6CEY0_9BACT|nr:carbamate kinase [Bythopirellula polymerisocia]TWU22662.1 Carbamate kinase 1 [Bythopirellula polymerisocia]
MPSVTPQKLVIALGGNAISVPGEQGNIDEQFAHTRQTARILVDAFLAGYQPILTHGNGPQVGNILRRVELARHELYTIPLELCVADTQAGMGYMIAQCLMNELAERGQPRQVTTLVTSVLVDGQDPAFENPTKPIGPKLVRAVAEAHREIDGWKVRELEDGSFRRIVSSPRPLEILELPTIRQLVEADELVICCGGGGIPICRDARGQLSGAAAVIDKDLTSSLLARELGVGALVILTGVEHVSLNFGKPNEKPLREITISDANEYLNAGHFGSGSMRPKVEAAIDFVTHATQANPVAVIGHLDCLTDLLAGRSGTRITA